MTLSVIAAETETQARWYWYPAGTTYIVCHTRRYVCIRTPKNTKSFQKCKKVMLLFTDTCVSKFDEESMDPEIKTLVFFFLALYHNPCIQWLQIQSQRPAHQSIDRREEKDFRESSKL